jgi:transposase-like protein
MPILYPKKAKTQWHLRSLVEEDYQSRWSSLKTAKTFQISHTTVLHWHHRFDHENTLENRSSAPLHPHRTHELDHLYLLHYLYKTAGNTVSDIEDYFEVNSIIFPRSSIYYHLKSWWLIAERKEKGKRIAGKFKKYEPWFLHIDITYWPKIDGAKYYIHTAVDRATRLMYLELHPDKKAETVVTFLKSAIEFFPFKITRVLTDNGREYTLNNHRGNGKYGKENILRWAFDLVCDAYDISHRHTAPYTPQTLRSIHTRTKKRWIMISSHSWSSISSSESIALSYLNTEARWV